MSFASRLHQSNGHDTQIGRGLTIRRKSMLDAPRTLDVGPLSVHHRSEQRDDAVSVNRLLVGSTFALQHIDLVAITHQGSHVGISTAHDASETLMRHGSRIQLPW